MVDRPGLDDEAELAEPVPGADVALVIGDADDDLVAGRQLAAHGGRQVLHQDGCRGAEDDLVGALRVDEHPGGVARLLQRIGGGERDLVAAADLHVFLVEERVDALHRAFQDLRPAGIVEKHPAALQAGELGADILHVERRVGEHICLRNCRIQGQ
jgi:hypothetical protein